jgi:spore coat protein U-like protein
MLNKFAGTLAIAGICVCPLSFAASETHTLNVSANVTGNCRFNDAGPTSLVIGNAGGAIDPSDTADATGSAAVLYRCTTGTSSTITVGDGQNFSGGARRVADGAGNFMSYALAVSGDQQAGIGHGAGQDLTVSFDATIVAADFQNVPAGSYSDSVVLTITP